jgi:hypothetical protein
MANIKISDLSAASSVAAGDLFEVSQGSGTLTSRKATGTQVQSFVLSSYAGGSSIVTVGTVGTGTWQGTAIAVTHGGTGATDAAAARTNLGLGTAATMTGPSGTIVGTTDTQSLSNKTLAAPTVTDYSESVVTANTTTAYTISLTSGTVQNLTLTGNCTFTFPTATAGKSFLLVLKQDATGSRTATWPAAVKWPASTAPTITATANKADLYAFTSDGTNWFGRTLGQNYL